MSDELIITETIDGHIQHIRLNRPERKNAITKDMFEQLTNMLLQADYDNTIHAVIISGGDDNFCAGTDLRDFITCEGEELNAESNQPVIDFLLTINRLQKPLLAAVTGPAIRVGAYLLLHCDYVNASEQAFFQLPGVNFACTPEGGASLMLPFLVGQRKSIELLMLGEKFDAAQAKEYGLVNQVSSHEQCLSDTVEIAKKIANQPNKTIKAIKRLTKRQIAAQVEDAILGEGNLFMQSLEEPETAKAVAAYINKKKS